MVSKIFYFHPYLGKWSNLTNIFGMGWNHQLGMYDMSLPFKVSNTDRYTDSKSWSHTGCDHISQSPDILIERLPPSRSSSLLKAWIASRGSMYQKSTHEPAISSIDGFHVFANAVWTMAFLLHSDKNHLDVYDQQRTTLKNKNNHPKKEISL